jgi:hypothetical protein
VTEQLLTILKICLLALLYLFFLRVLRAVWVEIREPARADAAAVPAAAPVAPAPAPAPAPPPEPKHSRRRHRLTQLTVLEPSEQRGRTYPLGDEITLGRAAGCQVTLDDTYASQIHARLFARDGQFFVEDLGSTNGTFLNSSKVGGPQVLKRGDKLKVGSTVMELA